MRVHILAVSSTLVVLAACGLNVVGLDPLPLDGSVEAGVLVDGAAPIVDAADDDVIPPAPKPDVCEPTENCTDGIDNDCNGVADCADPACTSAGYACVPAVPAGFSLIAFESAARDACPTGFTGTSTDLLVDPNTAPASCGCTCAVGTQPSCVTGQIQASFGSTSSCSSGSGSYTNNAGGCVGVNYTILANVKTTPLAPTGGTCVAEPATSVDRSSALGRSCAINSALGGGCAGGGVCARAMAASFKACVSQPGDVACAGKYASKHIVGTALADSRDCTACTCAATPTTTCTNAVWNQYTSNDCTGTAVALKADGLCDPSNAGSSTYHSSKYVATVNASCGTPTAAPSPSGAATILDRETVCCAP